MAMRIKWDKYEAALLIDTFWLIENEPTRKKEHIQNLSAALRQKAINAGLEIDEVFRNFNGISMQLAPIAHAFFPERPTLTTSLLFEEMVAIYDNDYQLFQSILAEANANSKKSAYECWTDQLKFAMCSCEALQTYYPALEKTFELLSKIYQNAEILPEQMKTYTEELVAHTSELKAYFGNEFPTFRAIYSGYLEDISDDELPQLKSADLVGVFKKTKTEANTVVKNIADEFKKNQAKAQMFDLWRKKTGTKNPADWSSKNRTPILRMVKKAEYDDAKKAFETLNRNTATELEIQHALSFLNKTSLFDDLSDTAKIDAAFKTLLGSYKNILTDLDKVRDALERLAVDAYDWANHPSVNSRIYELARAEYDAGGSDKVIAKIDTMKNEELKSYLVKLIKENIKLGAEIMNGGE